MPKLWGTTPRQSLLRQSPLSHSASIIKPSVALPPSEKQLPGPHFLLTFTVPETLRPFIRSHQHTAYQALFNASSTPSNASPKTSALSAPTCPVSPASSIPGAGSSSTIPTSTISSRAVGSPKTAPSGSPLEPTSLSPSRPSHRSTGPSSTGDGQSRAARPHRPTGLEHPLERPQPGQSKRPHLLQYLAPYVFKVAISNRRIVSLKDRTVTFTYRKPGSARPRTTHLDAIEFIRRFLQHVLPDGFMKVRHFGFMNTRCAIPTDTMRRMILQRHPVAFKTPDVEAPAPFVASCPTCGKPMQVVMRRWTSNRAFLDTG